MRYLLILAVLLQTISWSTSVDAQERKRTPALREQVYAQLARAQSMADAGDVQGGLAVLANVESKLSSMNSYERAMLWNFYGFMYYGQDDIDRAIGYFAKVVKEEPIPDALLQGTLFSLAQLSMGQEQYTQTLSYLDQYQQLLGAEVQVKALVLRAQALYQMSQYQQALPVLEQAMALTAQAGQRADENWYILLRALYFELGQTEQVAATLVDMVKHFNKPDYWVQLAGIYGQLGDDQRQLAVLEAAHQQGFLRKQQDIMQLAQAYFLNQVPYKAGQTLERALQAQQLTADLPVLRLLAQSWVAARETDKAVAALQRAAALTDDGELDAQRAQVLLNAERHQAAIEAAEQALAKGGLKQPGNMHLVIGMAQLNLGQFNPALQAFATAKQFDDVRRMASQWERYAAAEQQQAERLAALKASQS